MQLIDAAEVIGQGEVETAVKALVEIAEGPGDPRERIDAAQILLSYGIRNPYSDQSLERFEPEPDESE